ncbi:hypothetical protein QAD02_020356 [Eretmocerus hayati]|uniref:Uncharacterized protein n=1 Tax=Eretmocerus hayati TaxID=131215 RepID=A0ACC2PLU5_9HYME|nr:hypothetical protein QAD02_020356 [Eretmocerus hayati]
MIEKVKNTRNFLKENNQLSVTRADKGNGSVVILKDDYNAKVEQQLASTIHYEKLDYNPLKKLQNATTNFHTCWKERGVFESDFVFSDINCNVENTTLPRTYGNLKTHKKDIPARTIVSAPDDP